ncbi:hypothetical protein BH09ACT5_BH09ACT5_10470 [soil metagenome]
MTPVFASDEEALAAAEAAYRKYTAVSDQIFHEGGNGAQRLSEVATGDLLEVELEGFEQVRKLGYRNTGETAVSAVQLQQYSPSESGEDYVMVYLCEDVSAVDVLDSTGASVVSATRPARTFFEVSFDYVSGALLVSRKEAWDAGC